MEGTHLLDGHRLHILQLLVERGRVAQVAARVGLPWRPMAWPTSAASWRWRSIADIHWRRVLVQHLAGKVGSRNNRSTRSVTAAGELAWW